MQSYTKMRVAPIAFAIRIRYAGSMQYSRFAGGWGERTCAIAKVTVFIVDGSSIIQERLSTLLAELDGVEVVGQAQNMADAVTAIRAGRPDLVIQDVQTAGGNGLELLAAIKQGERAPVVIVLTNDAYPPYRKAYLQAGADYFFDKSSEFDRIPAVLGRFLMRASDLRRWETMKYVRSEGQSEEKKLNWRQRWSAAQPAKMTAFWLCLASVVLTMVVGFNWGGWVTGGTAQKTAETMAMDAVIQRLAPICVAQFDQDPQRDEKLAELREISNSWERNTYVKDQTWTIMPGEEAADSKVSVACVKLLLALSQ
jgi:DNA-binding NarL/FixJ family response regulator